jgi:transposase-like protein
MALGATLMKVLVKVADVVALAKLFEASPAQAMTTVVDQMRRALSSTLERIAAAEIEMFLGQPAEQDNARNGFVTRTYAIKGFGSLRLRLPRDRKGRYVSKVVPPHRRYDEATEKDLAQLHLSGISTRMLSLLSGPLLGVRVSRQEVTNSMHAIVPAAKKFLDRPLGDRKFKYLYVDGTNFNVRRTTVEKEPTLVVIGVDETDHKSILAMVQGDKDSRGAWEMVFRSLKDRGLDHLTVTLGVMDGLPGLAEAFREAFPNARVARCWVHKSRNVFPRVPKRYQAAFKADWDAAMYAESRTAGEAALEVLNARWRKQCEDAVACAERDRDSLLVHYEFPKAHWEALRTTNPIERVNKEFKRRSKAMETLGPDGLKVLLSFTALRLEYGWMTTPIASSKLTHLRYRERRAEQLEMMNRGLLH